MQGCVVHAYFDRQIRGEKSEDRPDHPPLFFRSPGEEAERREQHQQPAHNGVDAAHDGGRSLRRHGCAEEQNVGEQNRKAHLAAVQQEDGAMSFRLSRGGEREQEGKS